MASVGVGIIAVILGITVGVLAIVFLVVPLFKGLVWLFANFFKAVGWLVAHVFRFVAGMCGDVLRAIGAIILAIFFVPLVLLNVIIGRWSTSAHYGRALQDELGSFCRCLYRVVIGHPARFLLLSAVTEGLEKRLPEVMAHAPGSDKPSSRTGQFDGYTIVGSLPAGGSGGRLYVAEPSPQKLAVFARAGRDDIDQVVIKAFSLQDGSTMPQIVRESRALEAARKLGLVLDHELTDERFYYVMAYVPGDSLTMITRRLHADSPAGGLGDRQLGEAVKYIVDLLEVLDYYHRGGLWHKDVKPDNIIICRGKAELVDLGLITPLRSAMTLTTHGTEYFRDPELVRMALRGAKVHEVDGIKFDLYGTGAVLYSVVENSFPAHGGLSQISKRCPEALRWVIRRAMTDLHQRYANAPAMLADLRAIAAAADPFSLKPIDLPSMRDGDTPAPEIAEPEAPEPIFARSPEPRTEPVAGPAARGFVFHADIGAGKPGAGAQTARPAPAARPRRTPALVVADWITGRYVVKSGDACVHCGHDLGEDDGAMCPSCGVSRFVSPSAAAKAPRHAGSPRVRPASFSPAAPARPQRRQAPPAARPVRARPGRPAAEQLSSARSRVRDAQSRVRKRMAGRTGRYNNGPNAGVAMAVFAFLGVGVLLAGVFIFNARNVRSGAVEEGPWNGFSIEVDGIPGLAGNVSEWIQDGVRREVHGAIQRGTHTVFLPPGGSPASAALAEAADAPDVPEPAPAPPETPTDSGTAPVARILIVSFLPTQGAGEARTQLDGLTDRLEQGGFGVLGLGAGEGEIEMVATAKRLIGLDNPDDEAAVSRVREWATAPESGLDLVLWVPSGEREWRLVLGKTLPEPVFERLVGLLAGGGS